MVEQVGLEPENEGSSTSETSLTFAWAYPQQDLVVPASRKTKFSVAAERQTEYAGEDNIRTSAVERAARSDV